MLTVKLSQGTEVQYNVPSDAISFLHDFFDNARDIVIDDAYNDIISGLLSDLFENKLPKDGVVSEEEINALIETAYFGDNKEKNKSLGNDAQYWIHDYVMYGLYLGNAAKFRFSPNGDSARGVRMTGNDSGYLIVLNNNNQGIDHPIIFQITSVSADLIHVQGGAPGTNYVDKDMDADRAIKLLLAY